MNRAAFIFILLVGLPDVHASSCDFGGRASEVDVFSLDNISIQIDLNYRKYVKDVFEIISDHDNFIRPDLKKYRKAELSIEANDVKCRARAKVRLTGDWEDHIDKENIITSLKLKMEEKSLSNIVKFKLFNPESRFGLNEMMFSALLRQYGVLSPRTTFARVKIGNSKKLMLLQEDLAKEMMEYNNRREDFLIKGSENIAGLYQHNVPKKYALFEIDNIRYVDKSHRHFSALNVLGGLNHVLDKGSSGNWLFLEYLDSPKFKRFSVFYLLLVASEAGHSSVFFNNYLYYDSVLDNFSPVYYDGNVRPFDFGKKYYFGDLEYNKIILSTDAEVWDRAISRIDSILDGSIIVPEYEQIKRYQSSFSNVYSGGYLERQLKDAHVVDKFLRKIRSNLEAMRSENITYSKSKAVSRESGNSGKLIHKFKSSYIDDFVSSKLVDEISYTCEDSQLFEVCEVLNGGINRKRSMLASKNNSGVPAPVYIVRGDPVIQELQPYRVKIGSEDVLEILSFDPIHDSVFIGAEFITIHCERKCQAVIKDAKLKNIKIELVFSDKAEDEGSLMVNKNRNLSGGLTIVDSDLENVSVNVFNAPWEDAFNCIRCSGFISDVEINNAASDGVDIDFSNLELGSVKVYLAGNDCLDVSSGQYFFREVKAEVCGDKALSIGEASQLRVEKIQVKQADIGIAVKDSSMLYRPDDYQRSFFFSDVNKDFAIYNKKQEYGMGKIVESAEY